MNNSKEHIFDADRPIENSSEDLLSRGDFVEKLDKAISNWKGEESLIIGLYGKWGDGKTSVKNLLKNKLQKTDIEILEFNPWQWGHSQNLTKTLIKELSSVVSKNDKGEKISEKLEEYSAILFPKNNVFNLLSNTMERIFVFISACGMPITNYFFKESPKLQFFIIVLFTLLLLWGLLGNLLKDKFYNKEEKSLEDSKSDLKKLIEKYDKSILIIIDDIDRLYPNEIRELFKVIKSNLDFPNIIFLTLFQRGVVENSLQENGVDFGKGYLEKIIQVGIDLPSISKHEIDEILCRELDKVIKKYKASNHFDQDRWTKLLYGSLCDYFKNLRDIKRFISILKFDMEQLYIRNVFEGNFIDLVGINTLKMFEPAHYKNIFINKYIFVHDSYNSNLFYDKDEIKNIFDNLSKDFNRSTKNIVDILFPEITFGVYEHRTTPQGEDLANQRICHKEHFDKYFTLFIKHESFLERDFEHIIAISSNEERLFHSFSLLHDEKKLGKFLQGFYSYIQYRSNIPIESIQLFLRMLFRLGDVVSDKYISLFELSPLVVIRQIIMYNLNRKELINKRDELFLEAMNSSLGIFLPIDILFKRYEDKTHFDLFREKDNIWIKDKILEFLCNNKDKIKNNMHLGRIVFMWKKLDEKVAQIWLNEYVKDDNNFIFFLNQLVLRSVSSSAGKTFRIHVKSIKIYFYDIEKILSRFEELVKKNKVDTEKFPKLILAMKKARLEFSDPEKYNDDYLEHLKE